MLTPATGAITPAQVDAWVDRARPGEEMVYAWGDDFPRAAPGVIAARRAFDRGAVTFVARRSPGRIEYIMQRVRRRVALAEPLRGGSYAVSAERSILAQLGAAARTAAPCPSNAELALRAGIDEEQARYVVRRLRDAGRIDVELVRPHGRRRITIRSSGRVTGVAL